MSGPLNGSTAGGAILLVEDEDTVREALEDTLRLLGYKVHAACCGEEAFRLAQLTTDHIDLVISDYVMPGMNAIGLYDALETVAWDANMLVITGYPMPFSEMFVDEPRHIRWTRKPISLDDLARLVEEMRVG